jgi:DNA-binding response OmpR family regulator
MAEAGGYDLILLDIMLPGLSGMEVLRRIRRASGVPVIMLTARDSVVDKVSGLDNGADDYITKPFAIEELLARIRSVLRKKNPSQQTEPLSAAGVVLDPGRRLVTVAGTPVELTKREFDLLHYLLRHKGLVVSREILLEKVWGFEFEGQTNAVDVYIRFLRGKIDDAFGVKLISTVRGGDM